MYLHYSDGTCLNLEEFKESELKDLYFFKRPSKDSLPLSQLTPEEKEFTIRQDALPLFIRKVLFNYIEHPEFSIKVKGTEYMRSLKIDYYLDKKIKKFSEFLDVSHLDYVYDKTIFVPSLNKEALVDSLTVGQLFEVLEYLESKK
jgi:hypothetical protein